VMPTGADQHSHGGGHFGPLLVLGFGAGICFERATNHKIFRPTRMLP
jgi:hypothetical protein